MANQKGSDGDKFVSTRNGQTMFNAGSAHDYNGASWKQIEMAILGAADTGEAGRTAGSRSANPQSLFDGAQIAADAEAALLEVFAVLPQIAQALAGTWTGASATAFEGALTKMHSALVEQYN